MVFHTFMRVPRATSRDPYGKIITPRDVRLYRSKYGPGITWYILHDSSRGRLLYSTVIYSRHIRGMYIIDLATVIDLATDRADE